MAGPEFKPAFHKSRREMRESAESALVCSSPLKAYAYPESTLTWSLRLPVKYGGSSHPQKNMFL